MVTLRAVSATLPSALRRLRAQVTALFFAHFWNVLLIAVSASQWATVWWVVSAARRLPPAVHVIGCVALYALNRFLAVRTYRRRRERRLGVVGRLYYAAAFTSLFCALFLIAIGLLWTGTQLFLQALTVEARTVQAGTIGVALLDTPFRWLANIGVAVIGLSFTYGYTIGQRRLRIRRLQLPLRACAAGTAGLRIGQISDIHIGSNLSIPQLQRFVGRVNALALDLVCITGDISDGPGADLDTFLPILAQLQARYGVFAILGNHDHYSGADRVAAALRRLTPFTVLRDECTAVNIAGQRLHIVGLDDHGRDWARGKKHVGYLNEALRGIPRDEPVLLLCHRPDVFPQAAAAGIGLTLAGHTHGGQIGIPWFNGRVRNLAEFVTRFDRGLYERGGSYLYVNCGLGVTGQRIRLSTPREITVIETVAAPADLSCG